MTNDIDKMLKCSLPSHIHNRHIALALTVNIPFYETLTFLSQRCLKTSTVKVAEVFDYEKWSHIKGLSVLHGCFH